MKTISRDWRTSALHEVPTPIALDAAAMPGARVLGDDGAEYVSMRFPTVSDDYAWHSAQQILASGAVPQFFEPGFEVTVGPTGADFTTLNAAISELLLYTNKNIAETPPASILIKTGYVAEEVTNVSGVDLSWIAIEAEDDWVEVDAAAITTGSPSNVNFMSFRNGAAPLIDCGFELVGTPAISTDLITGISSNGTRFYTQTAAATKPRGTKGFGTGTSMGANTTARLVDWQSIDCTDVGIFVRGGSYANLLGFTRAYGANKSLLCSNLSYALAFSSDSNFRKADDTARPTDIVVEEVGTIRVNAAVSEASLSQSPNVDTINGVIHKANSPSVYGQAQTLADDAVLTLTPPRLGGVLALTVRTGTAYNSQFSGMVAYSCGTSLSAGKLTVAGYGGSLDAVTTDVSGTSGTDGRFTVAARADAIKIENRSGAARDIYVSWL